MTATSTKKARKQAKKKSAKAATVKKTGKKAPTVKKTGKKAPTAKKAAKKTSATKAPTKKKLPVKKAAKKKLPAKTTATKAPAAKRTTKKVLKKKTSVQTKRRTTTRATAGRELIHGIVPYKVRRGEKFMNPKQLTHFRAILAAWRSELVDEINRTIHTMQDETINHPDPNDRATQETDMSLELRSRDRERKLIRKIDDTVALIDSGDYGYCVKCGVEVGIARLEARPTANLCIDCKTLDEIREKQMI